MKLFHALEETETEKAINKQYENKPEDVSESVRKILDDKQESEDQDDVADAADVSEDDIRTDKDGEGDSREESQDQDKKSSDEDDLNTATEMIYQSSEAVIAVEQFVEGKVSQEDVGDYLRPIKTGLLFSAAYLKEFGIEYGPKLLKALGKGLVYVLGMALKGTDIAIRALNKNIEKSIYSYRRLNAKIENIEKSIAILQKAGITKVTNDQLYDQDKVINALFTGTHFNPLDALKTHQQFVERYLVNAVQKADTVLTSIRNLAGQVQVNRINRPEDLMRESTTTQGLVKKSLQGYEAPNDFTDVYCYPHVLPGNLIYVAYLPKNDLTDRDDIYTAYRSSQFFFGKNLSLFKGYTKVSYLTLAEIKQFNAILKSIVAKNTSFVESLKSLQNIKKSIGYSLRATAQAIMANTADNKDQLKVTQFISLKIYFLQKCYTRAMIDVDIANRKILFSYIKYMEASLLQLADQVEDTDD